MFRILVAALAGLLLGAAPALAADRTWPALPAQAYVIDGPRGIDEEAFVRVGGIDQWVTIRGRDRANPVLLIIPGPGGGPGNVLSNHLQAFLSWEADFTVVMWDPRGSGKTLARAKGADDASLSLDRHVADGLELGGYLRERLGKRRIALLASQYGSTIALRMLRAQPNAFSVYVGVSQVTDAAAAREQYFFDRLKTLAAAARDEAGLKALAFSGWDVWGADADPKKRAALISVYRNYRPPIPNFAGLPPHWAAGDLGYTRMGMLRGDAVLLPAWRSYDFAGLGDQFAVPLVIINGEEDRFGPTPMARRWLDGVKAPSKVFNTVPVAGNHVMETHPEAVREYLLRDVRPLAVAGEQRP